MQEARWIWECFFFSVRHGKSIEKARKARQILQQKVTQKSSTFSTGKRVISTDKRSFSTFFQCFQKICCVCSVYAAVFYLLLFFQIAAHFTGVTKIISMDEWSLELACPHVCQHVSSTGWWIAKEPRARMLGGPRRNKRAIGGPPLYITVLRSCGLHGLPYGCGLPGNPWFSHNVFWRLFWVCMLLFVRHLKGV